ncbi:MAG: hypothetical protein ACI8WP_001219, partial [Flavobacteriaceae bacterium]
ESLYRVTSDTGISPLRYENRHDDIEKNRHSGLS